MTKKEQAFFTHYEDEWDFSHQNIEMGNEYYYFAKEKGFTVTKETFPIHFSQVPDEYKEEYRDYIKKDLVVSFCYPEDEEEFAEAHSLQNAIDEYALCVGIEEDMDLTSKEV